MKVGHTGAARAPTHAAACAMCGTPLRSDDQEMLLSTNRGFCFPTVAVHWCPRCEQTVWVELDHYPRECRCDAHLETDLADHASVPCAQQLVSVVFESCARCGQVREVYLNH